MIVESLLLNVDKEDSRAVAEALESADLSSTLTKLKGAHVAKQMVDLVLSDREAAMQGFAESVKSLSQEDKTRLMRMLQPSGSLADRFPGTSRVVSD